MTQFRIIYYRPYLSHPDCDEAQRTIVTAKDEAEAREIYEVGGCEIYLIEELHPVEAAFELESLQADPRTEWERDWDDFAAETEATRESDRPQW